MISALRLFQSVDCAFYPLQLLLFLKGFSESERNKLAMLTGILLANGTLNASILNSLYNENLVKEGNCGKLFWKCSLSVLIFRGVFLHSVLGFSSPVEVLSNPSS